MNRRRKLFAHPLPLVLFSLAGAGVLAVPEASGWGKGHGLIRSWAVERLPEWQRERLGAEALANLATDYTSLQDQHAGGRAPHLDPYCGRFTCRVGLHPSAGESGEIDFVIEIEGEPVFATGPVRAGDPPVEIDLELPAEGFLVLTLRTLAGEGADPKHNLAVWGEPTLHRATGQETKSVPPP